MSFFFVFVFVFSTPAEVPPVAGTIVYVVPSTLVSYCRLSAALC